MWGTGRIGRHRRKGSFALTAPVTGTPGCIVTLSDCKLFSACLHEAKPLTLRREGIDNLPRFGVNPVNVTIPKQTTPLGRSEKL